MAAAQLPRCARPAQATARNARAGNGRRGGGMDAEILRSFVATLAFATAGVLSSAGQAGTAPPVLCGNQRTPSQAAPVMREFGEPVSYQLELYRELREAARDFFCDVWHDLSVRVRINPLIIGSTGTGKTFLVRRLAEELNLPLFIATAGDWVLLCATARGAPPTLPRLYKFVEDSPQGGILFLDEFEKLGQGGEAGTTDWRKFCQLEIFSVLDRRIIDGVLQDDSGPKFSLTAEKLGTRFQRSILVICAGAWQSLWDSTEAIGFAACPDETRLPSHSNLALD